MAHVVGLDIDATKAEGIFTKVLLEIIVHEGPIECRIEADKYRLAFLRDANQSSREMRCIASFGSRPVRSKSLSVRPTTFMAIGHRLLIDRTEFDVKIGLVNRARRPRPVKACCTSQERVPQLRYQRICILLSWTRIFLGDFTIGGRLIFFFQNSTSAFLLSENELLAFQKWHGIISWSNGSLVPSSAVTKTRLALPRA